MKQPNHDPKKAQRQAEPLPLHSEPKGEGYHVPREEASSGQSEQFDPRRVIGIMLSFWWLILLVVLAGTGAGVAYTYMATPKFRAVCQYEIFSEQLLQLGRESTMEAHTRSMGRQIMLLKSEVLKTRVRSKLQPEWGSKLRDLDPEIHVRQGNPRSVLNIWVEATDEDYARVFLEELISAYQEMRQMEELSAREEALRGLRLEKMRLENELQAARQRLVQFRERHNIKMTAMKADYEQRFLDNLMQRENSLRMERAMIGTQLRALEGANAPTVQDVLALTLEAHAVATGAAQGQRTGDGEPLQLADDPADDIVAHQGDAFLAQASRVPGVAETKEWEILETSVARLEALYNKQLETFKPDHPNMVQLRQRIQEAKDNIEFQSQIARKRLQARFNALKIQEDALSSITTGWRGGQGTDLSIAEQSELQDLMRQTSQLSTLVSAAASRAIDVAAQSGDSLITRVVTPTRSMGQVWPRVPAIVGGSFGGSLAIGVALAFALFYMDTKFLDVIAIEQRLGLPFISGIPSWERVLHDFDPEQTVVMDKSKPNAASESYRSMRISLESFTADKKGYSLLITSSDAGEGKSVTTANLGIAYSWTGKRVLLVDGDLRRPNLHNVLDQKNPDNGLAQVFLEEVGGWRDVLKHTEYEGVDFIPAGKFKYEASELCSRDKLKGLLDDWEQEYDIVLFDSAPVGRIVDTAMIAKGCDGVVLMALHGKASYPAMRHALRRLEGCNVLGFCLNAIELPKSHGGYYNGYSNYKWRYGLYSYYDYYTRALYGYGYYDSDEQDKKGRGTPAETETTDQTTTA